MKNLAICLIFLAGLLPSCTQVKIEENTTGTLTGIAADKTTGEPVPVVNLVLTPGGNSTVTGSDGSFSFTDLKGGTYTIAYTKDGYKSGSSEVYVEAGLETQANLLIERIPAVITADSDELDFGESASINTLSFNIVNPSYETLSWEVENSCPWIADIQPSEGRLAFGKTSTIVVTIDRSSLADGENETVIVIRSSNGAGNAEVKIRAVRNDPERLPEIEIAGLYDKIDYMEGTGFLIFNVKDTGHPPYSELRLAVISYKDGYKHDEALIGLTGVSGTGSFITELANLDHNLSYRLQLSAISPSGTAYSNIFEIPVPDYLEIPALGLAVQKENIGSGNFNTVNSLCENSIIGGYSDWRLPDIDELMSIYTLRSTIGGFSSYSSYNHFFWSSTPSGENATQIVRFGSGSLSSIQNGERGYGRCVRTLTSTE